MFDVVYVSRHVCSPVACLPCFVAVTNRLFLLRSFLFIFSRFFGCLFKYWYALVWLYTSYNSFLFSGDWFLASFIIDYRLYPTTTIGVYSTIWILWDEGCIDVLLAPSLAFSQSHRPHRGVVSQLCRTSRTPVVVWEDGARTRPDDRISRGRQ